jgi:glycerol-3-phosphate acyltransferase PlsX
MIRENIGGNIVRKAGYLLMRPAFEALKSKMDYAEYGGAPFLGENGISIIGHGRSSARAIKNAIRVALEFAKNDVNRHIHDDIVQNMELVKGK